MVGVEAVQNIRWGHSTFSLPRENEKWHRLTLYCENLNKGGGGGGRISPEIRLTANLYFFSFLPFFAQFGTERVAGARESRTMGGWGSKICLESNRFSAVHFSFGLPPPHT